MSLSPLPFIKSSEVVKVNTVDVRYNDFLVVPQQKVLIKKGVAKVDTPLAWRNVVGDFITGRNNGIVFIMGGRYNERRLSVVKQTEKIIELNTSLFANRRYAPEIRANFKN